MNLPHVLNVDRREQVVRTAVAEEVARGARPLRRRDLCVAPTRWDVVGGVLV